MHEPAQLAVRQAWRRALQHHLRAAQVDAQFRPGCGRLLARAHARIGRGPAVRGAPHHAFRLRGHRPCRHERPERRRERLPCLPLHRVQIHAAHFFFLSRFISPAVNHRTDAWGGSLEKRARILLEILHGIREATALHITIKINSNDFHYGGLTEADCVSICLLLDAAGIDSIEVSGNGTSVGGIRAHKNEGYFVPAAAAVAEAMNCPVFVVGGFRALDTMEAVLNNTKLEAISLSRPLTAGAGLPAKVGSRQRLYFDVRLLQRLLLLFFA